MTVDIIEPQKTEEGPYFILKYGDGSFHSGKYVDLDRPSGGYPYAVSKAIQAHRFSDEADALRYAAMFKTNETESIDRGIQHKVFKLYVRIED
jgi:hypothetical protein